MVLTLLCILYTLIGLSQQTNKTHNPQVCHSERSVSGVEESSQLMERLQLNRCEDPSTPYENLRFSSVTQDDNQGCLFALLTVLSKAHKRFLYYTNKRSTTKNRAIGTIKLS